VNTDTVEALRTAAKALAYAHFTATKDTDRRASEGYFCDVEAIQDFDANQLLDYINAVVDVINESRQS